MGWVEGGDGVVGVVCVGSVRDGRRAHGMCVVILCVGPVWGVADGWGGCCRAAAVEAECRVVCLPVWCGRCVEVVSFVGVMVCGAMGLCVCAWLVVWSVFFVTASEMRAQRRSGLGWYTCHR